MFPNSTLNAWITGEHLLSVISICNDTHIEGSISIPISSLKERIACRYVRQAIRKLYCLRGERSKSRPGVAVA
jgi:hypothetical protein